MVINRRRRKNYALGPERTYLKNGGRAAVSYQRARRLHTPTACQGRSRSTLCCARWIELSELDAKQSPQAQTDWSRH
jgi:hypothetical protein